ncbi:FAD/NAD(P)-binding domain-containing protein [Coniophora puteana RWD-64-598 SS2]|uniref:FAD/NAD(P)-binding domain-containing protein n=1 Tax=Coniophora puteana (strain RWD-64-598) TaxID=741705 RepID=A0A5M3MMI6_CONPW|nr:FAD/NAD(P)-binding domain-containing protein [Coniophora puteana RWD-64-598 SS2]EIW79994.1 FAD/NAD(P)-binding domain-containing protein [Coniophora puteana RWD-64-598 SS2]
MSGNIDVNEVSGKSFYFIVAGGGIPQKWNSNTKFAWNRMGFAGINFMWWTKSPKQIWERFRNPGWNCNNFQAAVKEIEGYLYAVTHGLDFQGWDIRTNGGDYLVWSRFDDDQAGLPKAPVPISGNPRGAFFTPKTIDHKRYTRSYSMTAFYFPHTHRPNLKVLTRAYVTKLVTSVQSTLTATGVEFTHGGKTFVVNASKEVVLCAGYSSCQVLVGVMFLSLSEYLSNLSLLGLAKMYRKTCSGISFELKDDVKDITLDALRDPEARKEQVELHKKAEGAFTPMSAISDRIKDVYALAKKKVQDEWDTYSPGLQEQYKIQLERLEDPSSSPGELVLVPGFLSHPNPPKPGKKYFTIILCLNHDFSRGYLSSDPNESPECDPQCIQLDADLQTFVKITKFLADWLKATMVTIYHTAGSLSMLPKDKDGVVDPNLKVYVTTNFYVADLSIMSLHLAPHTLTTAYAISTLKIAVVPKE